MATNERGSAAGASASGMLQDVDYLGPMRPPERWRTVPKMMSDPVISAGLAAIKEPILGLNWWVEPPTDDPEDQLIADFLTADLFDMPGSDWPDYLTQVLRYLELGVMLFERVYEKRDDGLVHLDDLAPREPGSIVEWQVDPHGRAVGCVQAVAGGQRIPFKVDDLLVFTHKPVGGVWTGTSLLRTAYKPWLVWDQLERGEAVATTLRGAGVTTAKLVSDQAREAAEQALMTVRVGEKNYFLADETVDDFKITGIQGATLPFDVPIRRHQLNFLRAIGAEFIAMGGEATGGSRAVHTDKTNTFLLRLNGTADAIGSVHTRKLFPPLVTANFGPQAQGKAWRLKHSKLDVRDLQGLSAALAQLAERGWLTVQPGDEDWLRTAFDMPEMEKAAAPSPTGEASGTVDGQPVEEDAYALGGA